MVRSSKATVFNDFDLNQYEVSEALQIPKPLSSEEEKVLLMDMESNPDKYLYVDFLGSTYMMEIPDDPRETPTLILLEGAHFTNLLPKRYWFHAEEFFWDKFQWAGSHE